MTTNEYIKHVQRENTRVSHEWDAFMQKHGWTSWECASDESKKAAGDLAEAQGIRSKQLKERHEKAHEETHAKTPNA